MIDDIEIKKVAKEKYGNGKFLTEKEEGFRKGAEWALEQVKNNGALADVSKRDLLMKYEEFGCSDDYWNEQGREYAKNQIDAFFDEEAW